MLLECAYVLIKSSLNLYTLAPVSYNYYIVKSDFVRKEENKTFQQLYRNYSKQLLILNAKKNF